MSAPAGRPKVGLALSGGVVRGFAHLGVLRVLERAGIPVDLIAGTSAGALVGAGYCAGVPLDRLIEFAAQINWLNVARPCWPRHGLFSFARLERQIANLIGDAEFKDLKHPLGVVASDLMTHEAVVLNQGKVARAVHASCCLPFVSPPLEIDGRLLVDGTMANNLPISIARSMGADYVIAVSLLPGNRQRPSHLVNTLFVSLGSLIHRASDPHSLADVVIQPIPAGFRTPRLSQRQQLIAMGEQAILPHIEKIRQAVGA